MAYSKGQPDWGAHFADALEDLCKLHDPSTIAAVIVEPMAGSAGVYAPPKGYLERLRQICDQHGILLIFDEVITGFGRTGAAFASEKLGVIPDMMTTAKGITNGAVPMGATFVRKHVYDAFMHGPEHLPELFHGYTYSAHPLACAASMATLDIYQEEGLFQRVADLAPYWEEAVHSLKGAPHVVDIRNWGLVAGVELDPGEHGPGRRAFSVFLDAYENGILMRSAGNTMVFTPPLIIEKAQIDQMVDMLRTCLGRAK